MRRLYHKKLQYSQSVPLRRRYIEHLYQYEKSAWLVEEIQKQEANFRKFLYWQITDQLKYTKRIAKPLQRVYTGPNKILKPGLWRQRLSRNQTKVAFLSHWKKVLETSFRAWKNLTSIHNPLKSPLLPLIPCYEAFVRD